MRTGVIRTSGVAVVAAASALAASSALAVTPVHRATSSVFNFETPSATVGCGITSHVPGTVGGKKGTFAGLQCGAEDLPNPSKTEGDPFVLLGQGTSGRAKIVDIGDDDYTSQSPQKKLAAGTVWSRDGITCTIATSSVTCKNTAGYGFTLKKGSFKPFS